MELIKRIISEYPERIILTGASVLLIIIAIKTIKPPVDEDVKRARGLMKKVEDVLKDIRVKEEPSIIYLSRIKDKWEKTDRTKYHTMNNWTAYRPPVTVVQYYQPPPKPRKEILPPVLPAPPNEWRVYPDLPDWITITWENNSAIRPNLAPISGFRIYRKGKEEPEPLFLKELKPPTISLTDTAFAYTDIHNFPAETECQYYITAFTEEKPEEMRGGVTESTAVTTSWITIPKDVKLTVAVAELDKVYFKIVKYFKVENSPKGKWETNSAFFKKGEPIGKIYGKKDFRTNYLLEDIKREERKRSIDPGPPRRDITEQVFTIVLKNIKTGKEEQLPPFVPK